MLLTSIIQKKVHKLTQFNFLKLETYKNRYRASRNPRRVKKFIQKMIREKNDPHKQLQRYISQLGIKAVVDIGGNVGQFGVDLRNSGFAGQLVSFEPVTKYYNVLKKTSERYPPWKSYNIALGDAEGTAEINVSGNSGLSSSLLVMKTLHLENFPSSKKASSELVTISTLTNEVAKLGLNPSEFLLKIDTQGYEGKILSGASDILKKIPLCFIEISISQLYDQETTYLEILNYLLKYGHEVVQIYRSTKANNGDLLQIEVITKKRELHC